MPALGNLGQETMGVGDITGEEGKMSGGECGSRRSGRSWTFILNFKNAKESEMKIQQRSHAVLICKKVLPTKVWKQGPGAVREHQE